MKRTMTKGSVALCAIAGLVLAGCASGSRDGGGGTEEEGELLITTPEAANEIDYANWNLPYGEPASIDPIKGFNYPENQVTANICDTLLQVQPDFSLAPNLASDWEEVDSQTYIFQIRDDVTFWDGSPMTMEDVLFSVQRSLDDEEGSFWAGLAVNIASVEQTDDWEMTITLEEPDTVFAEVLSSPVGAVVQQSYREEAGEDFGNPVGGVMCTGPFSVKDWSQGQSITLERNDDYWNEEKKAKAEEFEINFIIDPTAISNSLSSGDTLGGYDVPLPALSQLSTSESGQLLQGKGQQLYGVIAAGDGAFSDPAVRRAITRATDRDAIAETVYEGTASAARSVAPEAAWESMPEVAELRDETLPDLSFDIEAAKAELENASSDLDLSEPIKIAYAAERTFHADILNELARGAEEIGLTLEPTGVPSAQFGAVYTDPEARAAYDGFITINYPPTPSTLNYLASIGGSEGDQNFDEFSSAEVDSVIEAAKSETDPEERAELTVELEGLIMEELPWIPVAQLNTRLFLDDSVTGVPASFSYLQYPWAADLGAAE